MYLAKVYGRQSLYDNYIYNTINFSNKIYNQDDNLQLDFNIIGYDKYIIQGTVNNTNTNTYKLNINKQDLADFIGLTPDKIKLGENILGISGTVDNTGVDTSDANATSDQILRYKTAYVKGEKVTGTMLDFTTLKASEDDTLSWLYIPENNSATTINYNNTGYKGGLIKITGIVKFVPTVSNYAGIQEDVTEVETRCYAEDIANAIGLTPDKIKAGETVLGVVGTA